MTHHLLSVHGPAERNEFGNYGSKEEMEAAFAATGEFNDKLHAEGCGVFGDIDIAEEAANEALVTALEKCSTTTRRPSPSGPSRTIGCGCCSRAATRRSHRRRASR